MTPIAMALSLVLVSTIMISAPIISARLRSAWLTEAEIAVLDLRGVGGRAATSARRNGSVRKRRGSASSDGRRRRCAYVGNGPFAQPAHAIEAHVRSRRPARLRASSKHAEIAVDQAGILAEKPKSIMRRTASGSTSVAPAATNRLTAAPSTASTCTASDRAAAPIAFPSMRRRRRRFGQLGLAIRFSHRHRRLADALRLASAYSSATLH